MKKMIVLLLALFAVLAGCDATGMDSGALDRSAGQPVVKLAYAVTQSRTLPVDPSTYYTRMAGRAEGYVEIENLAYTKQVVIHYSAGSAAWTTVNAVYVASIGNNREIWKFTTGETVYLPRWGGCSFDFAVEYKVNGRSYWDNNNGSNYKIDCGGVGVSRPQQVLSGSALYTEGYNVSVVWTGPYTADKTLAGTIVLKNLDYTKSVKVRYTTDNWATVKEANGVWVSMITTPTGGATGLEKWSFSVALPSGAATVKFAVSYTVGNVTYWDNNWGRNYTVSE